MDGHIIQWIATGIATFCLTLIGLLISFIRAESNRQGIEITELWKYHGKLQAEIGETKNRLSYIEGALGEKLS